MHIEGAPVLFRGHTAIAAHPVALSDNLRSLFPKGIINWISVFAKVLANVAVDILTTIPKVKTFQRTKKAARLFARFTTNPTWAAWHSFGSMGALSRTKAISMSFNGVAANFAKWKRFYLAQIPALPRTKTVVVVTARFATYFTKWRWFTVKFPKAFRGTKLSLLWLSKFFSTPCAVFG